MLRRRQAELKQNVADSWLGPPPPAARESGGMDEPETQRNVRRHCFENVILARDEPGVLRLGPLNQSVVGQHQKKAAVVVPVGRRKIARLADLGAGSGRGRRLGDWQVNA